jgi:hypothetical protein
VLAGVVACTVGTGFGGGATVCTGGLLPLKTPKAARIAKKTARTQRAMIATCVSVSVRPAMTNSRWPGERSSSSSGSTQTSSASS